MKVYKGNKPCPGCGRPGFESSRWGADENCHDCNELIKLGKQLRKMKSEQVEQYDSIWAYVTYCGDVNATEKLYIKYFELLEKAFDQTAKSESGDYSLGFHNSSRSRRLQIRRDAKQIVLDLYNQIKETIKAAEDKGLQSGQSLLMQLHSGDITLKKLDERLNGR